MKRRRTISAMEQSASRKLKTHTDSATAQENQPSLARTDATTASLTWAQLFRRVFEIDIS